MSHQDFVLLYLHIPKAAGTTMASLLFEQCRNPEEVQEGKFCSGIYYHPAGYIRELDGEVMHQVRETLHRPDLRAVTGHYRYGLHDHLIRPYRYATILREPVSRICSLYHFQRLNEAKYGHLNQVRLPAHTGLHQFVSEPPYSEIDNGMTRRISGQNAEIGKCNREMLERAMANLQTFSVVGLSDRFDETIVLMSQVFGWNEPPLYYSYNINSKRRAGELLDPRTRSVIMERNAYDVELYRVAQEIFRKQLAQLGPDFPETLHRYQQRKLSWYAKRGLIPHEELSPTLTDA